MDAALEAYIERRDRAVDEVRRILIDVLKVDRPADTIDLDVVLFGSGLGLDSVDGIELMIALESRFGLHVDDQVFRTAVRTVNSLVDLVMRAPNTAAASSTDAAPRAAQT